MTILFAVLAAVAIIAFGFVLWLLINERTYIDDLLESHADTLNEVERLRKSNRNANKINQNDSRRLRAEVDAAQRFAASLEEFHNGIHRNDARELAGAHALIEMLMDRIPVESPVKINIHEASRLFAPLMPNGSHSRKTPSHIF